MSIIETPTVDFVLHCNHSSKRKLDDYGPIFDDDDEYAADFLVRMKKDERKAVNSSFGAAALAAAVSSRVSDARAVPHARAASHPESTRSGSRLQFFIRMMSKTVVMHAFPQEMVKSIHERIETMTGIPVIEQCLIYRGKQLQWEQTLYECSVQNDANLQMVGRMRSTKHPQAWQVINDMNSVIYRLCRGEVVHDSIKIIKGLITSYLNMAPKASEGDFAGYFDIFVSSNAPAFLVMLYVSPCAGNKDHAECFVRHFLNSCRTSLNKTMHGYCARLVLELCNLLRRVGCDDPLYLSTRSTFGSLLETACVYHCSGNANGCVLLQDICPFVREIADRLLRDMDLSMDCTNVGPLLCDVLDFNAFLAPLRNGITKLQAWKGSVTKDENPLRNGITKLQGWKGSVTNDENPLTNGITKLQAWKGLLINDEKPPEDLLPAEEVDNLHLIFIQLLSKMNKCLRSMEECLTNKELGERDFEYSAWSQYLSILKELHQISKLYDGAEENFWGVLMDRSNMLCLLIIHYAKRTEDHHWILEHKDVTNFESRRHLAMLLFPEIKEDYEELHEMLIDRSQLLVESFNYIRQAEPESLHAGLFMEFKNEEATGPGVLREWFLLVCQAIFNPQNALFVACPNDRRRFFPNPASKVDPLHLQYFSFSGRVIALALMHRVQVGIVIDRVFFMQLAGKYITLEDIRDADPYLYSSCKQILEMDADFIDSDALGLTFVRDVEELGYRKVVELCPGGKSLVVNSKNREKYVDLLIQNRFVISISEQVSHFAKGFADILSNSRLHQFFFQSLELKDLDWMLHGSENTISVEDWKAHTEYNGYKESDRQISWFWEAGMTLLGNRYLLHGALLRLTVSILSSVAKRVLLPNCFLESIIVLATFEIVGRMSAEQRKVLLFFWTSVKYLPVEGFRGLASRLYIYKSMEPDDRLPSSHTCFYRLCFPSYSSMAVMKDRLGVVTQEHIGCSFGTW